MKKRNLIYLGIAGLLLGGCARNSELRVSGLALKQSWQIVEPYAVRGLEAAVEAGELQAESVPVIQEQLDLHERVIDRMVDPGR